MSKSASIPAPAAEPVYRHIAHALRDQIARGQLAADSRLPSTRALAQRFDTNIFTVQTAMQLLVREGWIARQHGKGTYVRGTQRRALKRVGIYCACDDLLRRGDEYRRNVCAELVAQLQRQGFEVRIWLDPRPVKEKSKPWGELVEAAQQHAIQAMVAVHVHLPAVEWIRKLPLPLAFATGHPSPYRVSFDFAQFGNEAIRALHAQGCRSVGVITTIDPRLKPVEDSQQFFEAFLDAARNLGLEIRNDWMKLGPAGLSGQEMTEFAAAAFRGLWATLPHPQGLVALVHNCAQGVIDAMTQDCPDAQKSLRVVFHSLDDPRLKAPFPATLLTSSPREVAATLIHQIMRQVKGEPCAPFFLKFRKQTVS